MMAGPAFFDGGGRDACAADIGFDEALELLVSEIDPLGYETVAIAESGGRRLACPAIARIDSPRRDLAAMDGYALGPPGAVAESYRSLGCIVAGDRGGQVVGAGEAFRIMTGAPLPSGAERVAMIEYCDVDVDEVSTARLPAGKPHIRRTGSDFRAGDELLAEGTILSPAGLVAAAAGDNAWLELWRQPSLFILATGDELAAPGCAAATPGAIADSVTVAVAEFGRLWGGIPSKFERLGDDAETIARLCSAATEDVVLILGGASRGDRDFSRAALLGAGMVPCFADVAIRPGKPLWYGRLGAKHVIGLPGNPTAAMTVARLFLAPLLFGLGGGTPHEALAWRSMNAAAPVAANGPREAFLCARSENGRVAIFDRQEASAQGMLAKAELLVRRMSNAPGEPEGIALQVLDF